LNAQIIEEEERCVRWKTTGNLLSLHIYGRRINSVLEEMEKRRSFNGYHITVVPESFA